MWLFCPQSCLSIRIVGVPEEGCPLASTAPLRTTDPPTWDLPLPSLRCPPTTTTLRLLPVQATMETADTCLRTLTSCSTRLQRLPRLPVLLTRAQCARLSPSPLSGRAFLNSHPTFHLLPCPARQVVQQEAHRCLLRTPTTLTWCPPCPRHHYHTRLCLLPWLLNLWATTLHTPWTTPILPTLPSLLPPSAPATPKVPTHSNRTTASGMGGSTSMRNPWTTGGLQKGGIAMMTTGRRATPMVATVKGIKWSFLERGRTAAGVQTGVTGQRGGTGPNMIEAGLPPDTGAGIAAGTQTAAIILIEMNLCNNPLLTAVCLCVHRERYRHRENRRSQSPDRHRKRPRRYTCSHLFVFQKLT